MLDSYTPCTHRQLMSKQLTCSETLHVDQVSTLPHWAAGLLWHWALRVPLLTVITLILDGFWAAVRVAVVVEEASEGELVKGVLRVLAVSEPAVEGVVVVALVLAVAAPQLVGVHGIKVGGVCGVCNRGDVGRHLLPQVIREVNGPEERMSFDFICAILAQPVLRTAAQFNDEIRSLWAQLGWGGDVQTALPVYNLV